MSLNYNFIDTLKLLLNSLKYGVMIAIIISMLIMVILLILNKDNKKTNYIISTINLILIIIICIYYIKDIFSFKFSNPINNIYFYFFNSIIYLIVMSLVTYKIKYKKVNYIIYGISLINILFSLFMTHYLSNQTLIVIGNIYPMIKLGNIIYVGYYIFIVIICIKTKLYKS
jgi:hypothetical protein